jgi:Fe-S-cluster-containing dehydrogenase component/DMSO reductase anchor subunit
MSLPLIDRARADGVTFVLTPRPARAPLGRAPSRAATLASRMPDRRPGPGEQYRFHFDMGACIGCKCCVVACNEQNGNPAEINWRRVGDIEGGTYPAAERSFLSMGCNHCLEPTCLAGCPVDAYTKDAATGIVRHSAETCIGCQYCTWNCAYGVPQFNPARGVVGKCDMCHGRLADGDAPACVSACPEGAIQIEIVNLADWRAVVDASAPAMGAPIADGSLSTTRVTLPEGMDADARPIDLLHVKPEAPHWPLVFMTVLTQLAVGAFATVWLLQAAGRSTRLDVAAIASLTVAAIALGASTLHLGRPIHAYRALKMWRRSWLSREVLLFSAFSGVASAYAALLWMQAHGLVNGTTPPIGSVSVATGALTAALGLAGVTASACIYRVPSRPAWNSWLTAARFGGTALVLGPLFTAVVGVGDAVWLGRVAAAAAGVQALLVVAAFLRAVASDRVELRGTARLLSTRLAVPFVARGALLCAGAGVLPLVSTAPFALAAALLLALAGELAGRYLFFVSVVPAHMASPYLARGSEAA